MKCNYNKSHDEGQMLGIDHISIHIFKRFASISIIQYQLYISGKCQFFLKVLYVGISVQIQNIGEGFFSPAPPPQT